MTCFHPASRRHALLFCLSLISPIGSSAPEDRYPDYSLDELMGLEISSASKRPETVADIPASVTIITRRDLERMGYASLDEVLRNVPGLYLLDNYEDQLIGVRGGIGGGIQFLVNGVPRHPTRIKGLSVPERSRLNIPVQSIDRIEVVRGPMSVIYGDNAFLGSINIITNQVAATPNLASVSYGNNGARQAFARLRREFDHGFVVLNGGYDANDGPDGRFADLMSSAQLARLDPRMHDDLGGDIDHANYSLDLSGNYRDISLDLQYSRMNYGAYLLTPPFDDGNRIDLSSLHAALGYQREVADGLRLATQVIYSSEQYNGKFDFILPQVDANQDQDSRRLDIEMDLDWSPSATINLIGGYRHRRLFNIHNNAQLKRIGVTVDQDSGDVSRNDLFVQADYRPIDALKLVAGVRWSHAASYQVSRSNSPPESPEMEFPSQSAWTPRLGAIWSVNERHRLKLLYGEARQDNQQVEVAKPEEIATWEANWLSRFDHGTLQLGLFQNRTDHLLRKTQFLDPASGQYRKRLDNSGRLRTRGVELIARLRPLRGLDWSFSASWQNSDDLENSGIAPGYSPHWLLKSQLSYRRADWTGGLSFNYVSSMQADWQWVDSDQPGVSARIGDDADAYLLVDANLRYDFPGRGPYANLHIGNLLDSDIRYPANELVDFRHGAPGPGRQALLTLGWKF